MYILENILEYLCIYNKIKKDVILCKIISQKCKIEDFLFKVLFLK